MTSPGGDSFFAAGILFLLPVLTARVFLHKVLAETNCIPIWYAPALYAAHGPAALLCAPGRVPVARDYTGQKTEILMKY